MEGRRKWYINWRPGRCFCPQPVTACSRGKNNTHIRRARSLRGARKYALLFTLKPPSLGRHGCKGRVRGDGSLAALPPVHVTPAVLISPSLPTMRMLRFCREASRVWVRGVRGTQHEGRSKTDPTYGLPVIGRVERRGEKEGKGRKGVRRSSQGYVAMCPPLELDEGDMHTRSKAATTSVRRERSRRARRNKRRTMYRETRSHL
jgi:hypothetical protein